MSKFVKLKRQFEDEIEQMYYDNIEPILAKKPQDRTAEERRILSVLDEVVNKDAREEIAQIDEENKAIKRYLKRIQRGSSTGAGIEGYEASGRKIRQKKQGSVSAGIDEGLDK